MKLFNTILLALLTITISAQQYTLSSPDNTLKIGIDVNQTVTFKVLLDGNELITPSTVGIEIDKITQPEFKIKKTLTGSSDQIIRPVVAEKSSTIRDNYNELKFEFRNKLSLVFRAYNTGIAYRWESAIADSIHVI